MSFQSTASVLFNGSTQHATGGNVLGFEYTQDFSVACWIKTTAATGYIVSKMLSSGNYTGWGFVLDSVGRVNVYLRSDNSPLNQIRVNGSTIGLADDGWHHVGFTWKGNASPVASDLHIYVDGQPETEAIIDDVLSATIVSAAAFSIASRNAGGDSPWAGAADEIAVWNQELSASDMLWVYNAGFGNDLEHANAPSGLVSWWRMGETGTPPTVPDEVSANDLTLVNSPTISSDAPSGSSYASSYIPESEAVIESDFQKGYWTQHESTYIPETEAVIESWFAKTFVGFDVGDDTPPVVSNLNPSPGSTLNPGDFVEFDVTDDSGEFVRVIVTVSLAGVVEVVHDGTQFRGHYIGTSSRAMIAGGYHYTISRRGGWTASPTFETFAIDAAGNEAL